MGKIVKETKENVFIDLSDGLTEKKLQIILPQKDFPRGMSTGASISALGTVSLSPKGQKELHASKIQVYGDCVFAEGYPFAPRKQYAPEYIREYLHLRPRTNKFASLLRVRNAATLAIHNFFNSEGYINIHTPILTSNDCEGAGEIFKTTPDSLNLLKSMVKEGIPVEEAFFDKKSFLSVSGQLHLEAAVHGLSKVYAFSPTFRAENSKTRLHLSEFYMVEAEIAFLEDLDNLTSIIEKLIKNVTKSILDSSESDITICQGENPNKISWLDTKFPVLSFEEARDILQQNRSKFKKHFDMREGLSKEHELFLVNRNGGVPTFIINWPKEIKPFYMRECENDPSKVSALDLLAPDVGELVGGSLRENDYNKLKQKLPKENSQLEWYLDLRKYGSVPTGGYGLGFERYLMSLLGVKSIKDVIPFPRWPHNCNL